MMNPGMARGKLLTPGFTGVTVTHCKHVGHFRSDTWALGRV